MIGENQLAAIRMRAIWAILNSLSIICDSINLSNTRDNPLAVISLDLLKAFYKVDWDLIFFGISFFLESLVTGTNSFKWLKLLLPISNLKFKKNDLLSGSFTLIQGFHRGSPLSILLRIIVAEVLAIFIDVDRRIKGI